jgi:hypothetical protein
LRQAGADGGLGRLAGLSGRARTAADLGRIEAARTGVDGKAGADGGRRALARLARRTVAAAYACVRKIARDGRRRIGRRGRAPEKKADAQPGYNSNNLLEHGESPVRVQYTGNTNIPSVNGVMSEDMLSSVAYLLHHLMGRAVVRQQEYDQSLTMLTQVYRENSVLRQRLADLERLASSWAGKPDNHEAIRLARAELRKGIGRIWL